MAAPAPTFKYKGRTLLAGFEPVGVNASLYTPKPWPPRGVVKSEPGLVVVCSWMAAGLKAVGKYTDAYKRLLPRARILLIESEIADMFIRGSETQGRRLVHARNVVKAALEAEGEGGSGSSIVLHCFSHGGCVSAMQLIRSLQRARAIDGPLAPRAWIIDSAPGYDQYERGVKGTAVGLPANPVLKWLTMLWIRLVIIVLLGILKLGLASGIDALRDQLLAPGLVATSTPRLYLYSAADAVVDPTGPPAHAAEAGALGARTEVVKFERAAHVGLVVEDAARYWDAVAATWTK